MTQQKSSPKLSQSANLVLVPFIGILSIILLIIFFNLPIIATLWQYSFDDGTYSHAYLIPFIVLYLYFTLYENNELQLRKKLSWFALMLLVLAGYILYVTSTAQISLAYWLAALMLLCTAINFLFKPTIKLFFPALYFIFLIPIWGLLTIPLQSLSIYSVNTLMSFTSIPVYVENEFVHIPSGVFEIADGCSGLRYLLTSLAISTLFSFLYLRTLKNTTIFISVAILGALITNWIRIVLLIIIGHETEMTSSLMADHNMFGWYLYIPFMLFMFKFGSYLAEKENNKDVTTNNSAKTKVNTPNWSLALILVATLLSFSTTLHMSENTVPETERLDVLAQPTIYKYSAIEIIDNTSMKTQLIYNFNENNLESKPTFFENNVIPKGWFILGKTIKHEEQIFKIKKGLKTATIKVSYEISGLAIGSASQFKLERLKHAMFGKSNTKLHWQFTLD